jgi:type II secretion system protein J
MKTFCQPEARRVAPDRDSARRLSRLTHRPRCRWFSAPRHVPHGFTLVEILIALGIFAIVLTAIFSTWTAILRARKVGLDAAVAVQRARMAARTLEEALGSARAFAANQPYYAFVVQNGSDGALSFIARLSKSFPRSGKFGDLDVRRVTFSVEPSRDGGQELVLRQNPLMMDLDVDEKEHPIVLAKNVKELKTEFWDLRQQDWSDEWDRLGTNVLPALVRVNLKLADSPHSTMVRQEITRIVSLPSTTVQPMWQAPGPLPNANRFQNPLQANPNLNNPAR